MKRLHSLLLRNNRGSGIVTVLVTLLFISALGASMLFLALTGYQIKASEKKSKQNFYSADTAMQQLRTGVEKAVTQSIASAYTNVLENYSGLEQNYEKSVESGSPYGGFTTLSDYMEAVFQGRVDGMMNGVAAFHDGFKQQLLDNWVDSGGLALFSSSGGQYTYSPAVLLGFLGTPTGSHTNIDEANLVYQLISANATISLKCGSAGVTVDNRGITLNDVTVTYTSASGYETNITAGITVKYPPFSYSPTSYSVADLSGFSMIARNGLFCTAPNLTLSGNAYAGGIAVTQNGAALAYNGGTLVSAGDVNVDNSCTLTTNDQSLFWAKSLTVSGGVSSMTLSGSTYVANDLTLNGENASATLIGKYFGFGNALKEDDTNKYFSSSILVNGRNTSLKLGGLTNLMLAGNSFIDTTGADVGSGSYPMGQSIAARSDQLAYLVPASCLPDGMPANPSIYTSQNPLSSSDLSSVMTTVRSLEATCPYYQYVSGVKDVYVNLSSDGSTKVLYLFFTFGDSQDKANKYFSGYYSQHSDEINGYLTAYLNYYSAAQSAAAAGNTYSGSVSSGAASGVGLASPVAGSTLTNTVNHLQTQYANLRSTLSASVSSSAASPYEYIVHTTVIGGLPDDTTEFKDAAGNVVGMIVKGAYTVGADTPRTLKLLITAPTDTEAGDVSVEAPFHGLIIAAGKVTMGASVDNADVSAALQATDSGGKSLLSFLNIGSNQVGEAGGAENVSWDTASLVGYSGWRKH